MSDKLCLLRGGCHSGSLAMATDSISGPIKHCDTLLGSKRRVHVSHRDRWFVFFIICMVTWLDFGIIFSFGAMFVALLDKFESNRSTTAIVQSLLVGVSLSFSVVSGALITRFGLLRIAVVSSVLVPLGFCVSFFVHEIKYLYVTISIISGMGISAIHIISIVVIERMFHSRLLPLCFAIHGTGVNVAGMIYPLLIERLLEEYGIQGTFLILGALFLNSFAAPLLLYNLDNVIMTDKTAANTKLNADTDEKAMLNGHTDENTKFYGDIIENTKLKGDNDEKNKFKVDISEKINGESTEKTKLKGVIPSEENGVMETEESANHDSSKASIISSLLTKPFLFLLVASAVCIPSINTFLGLTVDIFVSKGFTVSQGLFSFVPFNVFGILAKFIPVIAKKFRRVSSFALPILFCICGLLSQVIIYFTSNYVVMLLGASCNGLVLGGVFPTILIAGAKIVTPGGWPLASGLLITAIGILSACLSPIFGWMRDVTGSYGYAIIVTGIMQAAGAVLYTLALSFRYQVSNKKPQKPDQRMEDCVIYD